MHVSVFLHITSLSHSYTTTGYQHWVFTFGGSLLLILGSQLLTGLFLVQHYVADWSWSFDVIAFLLHDTELGIPLRLSHAVGASLLFSLLWSHYWRSASLGSALSSSLTLWRSGCSCLWLAMAVAFVGYVLPWGNMSFWALTVITNLLSVVPMFGSSLLYYC